MVEIWKPIFGYEDLYEVSNFGNVRSLDRYVNTKGGKRSLRRGRKKIPRMRANGYLFVTLFKCGTGKMFNIHRLVAQAFLKNPNNYPQVNHKDENKKNNLITNLEWCTPSYNSTYRNARKRTEESHRKKVVQETIDGDYVATYNSITEAGIAVGKKNRSHNIGSVCNGKGKTAYGYKWKFKENNA